MEKAHVALLHQLYSPLQPYYTGILWGQSKCHEHRSSVIVNGDEYFLILASEDFHPHKTGLWVCLQYFYPTMYLSPK